MINKTENSLEVAIKSLNRVVAHMGCTHSGECIFIKDLFVLKKYRNRGFEDLLLSKVNEYAKEKAAKEIKVYCGPEPFCPGGQMDLEQEILFYQQNGFHIDHYVKGVTPCMVKCCNIGEAQ